MSKMCFKLESFVNFPGARNALNHCAGTESHIWIGIKLDQSVTSQGISPLYRLRTTESHVKGTIITANTLNSHEWISSFLASQDALEVIVWVSESHCWTELTDVTLVSEDTYWGLYWETLIFNDTYGGDVREIVVLIMEVDKVVDEVTDMEIDK